jgi:hypothetical protein
MSAGLFLQYAVIAVLVAISALYTVRKLAPQLTSRWLASGAIALNKPWHARWVQALGRKLQPKTAAGHCGDGCDTCGSCGPKPPAAARPEAQPLTFRPRRH